MGDQLVGEGVRLGGHAAGHVVLLRVEHEGQQIGDGLPDARPGLDDPHSRALQGVADFLGHPLLALARLVALIHLRDEAAVTKSLGNLGLGRRRHGVVELGDVCAGLRIFRGHELTAHARKREGGAGVFQREVGDDGPVGPLHLWMHVRQQFEQAGRQVGQGTQDDAPHARERLDVVHGAVGHRVAAEGLGHVLQAMRRQARQGYAGEGEGVYPHLAHFAAARHALDEGAVEGGVVRQDRRAAHELRKLRHGLGGRRGTRDVGVGDVRERHDVLRNRHAGVHEGAEGIHYLAAAQARRGDLGQLTVGERKSRRLGIEDHDVIF